MVSRILLIMDEVNFGGAEMSLFTLCQALARRCTVHLVLYEGSLRNSSIREWCDSLEDASVTLHRCRTPLFLGPRRNLHRWLRRKASRQLAALIDEVHPDAVLVNLPVVERGQAALDAAELARTTVPVWGYLHSAHRPTTTGARLRIRDMLVPRLLRRFNNRLLTISVTASHDLSRRYGVAAAGIMYPPIPTYGERLTSSDRERLRAAAGLSNDFLLGIVGRVHLQHKGQDAALRVVGRLHTAGYPVHLVVIGDGPDVAALRVMAEQLRIASSVSCLGWRQDAGQLIPLLDAVVITSRHEGMPLTALQAAAAQVPVVGYGIDGLVELLPAEFRVRYGDEPALADTIGRMISGDLIWPAERMSQRARTWSDPERAANRLLDFVESAPAIPGSRDAMARVSRDDSPVSRQCTGARTRGRYKTP